MIEKKVLIGNGDVLIIKNDLENKYSCVIEGKENLGVVLVSKESLVEYGKDGIDFKSVPKAERNGLAEDSKDFQVVTEVSKNTDYSVNNLWVKINKFSNEMKVVKTTEKSIFFVDDNGKNRRTAFKNIKEIRNYGGSDLPEIKEDSVVKIENVEKAPKPRQTLATVDMGSVKKGKGKGKK